MKPGSGPVLTAAAKTKPTSIRSTSIFCPFCGDIADSVNKALVVLARKPERKGQRAEVEAVIGSVSLFVC